MPGPRGQARLPGCHARASCAAQLASCMHAYVLCKMYNMCNMQKSSYAHVSGVGLANCKVTLRPCRPLAITNSATHWLYKISTNMASTARDEDDKKEYFDSAEELDEKVSQLAEWTRESKHMIVFTVSFILKVK